MMKFNCVRTYLNGEVKVFGAFTQEEVDQWIEQNRVMRFGCSMFVNGELKYQGYHREEHFVVNADALNKAFATTPTRHVETDNPNGFIRTQLKYPQFAPPYEGNASAAFAYLAVAGKFPK